jgi:hypothetical protein
VSSLNVGGATSARWPGTDWPTSSRNDAIERADSIQRLVDDQRSLGPLATGTARHTNPTAAPTQQDFEVATRVGPNGVTIRSLDQPANRNPRGPDADRKSVNGYDHIMEALRTAALKRDAALAGASSSATPQSATADTAATSATPAADATISATAQLAYAPPSENEYHGAYVRNAIAAYARNSLLASAQAE